MFVADDRAPSLLLVGLASFVSALLVLAATPAVTDVALLWPANALIVVAALLGRPERAAGRVVVGLAGSFAANVVGGAGPVAAFFYTVANAAEVSITLWLMSIAGMRERTFGQVDTLARFVVISGLVAPMAGAAIGAATIAPVGSAAFMAIWISWYTSCALGGLVIVPLGVILWRLRGKILPVTANAWASATLTGIVVAGVTFMAFSLGHLPLLFLPLAAVVVVSVRNGWLGAVGALLIVAAMGGAFTLAGQGPISAVGDARASALFLQFYLATGLLTVLTVAALLENLRATTRHLRAAEARYRMLSDYSGDAILHVDVDGTCRFASAASAKMIGLPADALVGLQVLDFVDAQDRAAVITAHRKALAHPDATETCRYSVEHRERGPRTLETTTRAIADQRGEVIGVVSVIRDVTDVAEREALLTSAAETDPLTGLANRRAFEAALAAALADTSGAQFAVAILDIDHFKRVNDRYGHPVGDQVLRAVAEVAAATIRTGDMAARMGGEEFALLLHRANEESMTHICERVREAVEQLQVPSDVGEWVQVTLSIGAAINIAGEQPDRLITRADAQLYAAKGAGRNRLRIAA